MIARLDHVPARRCGGSDHEIAPAGPGSATEIAALLADAFSGYPWTDWLVPPDRRRERLHGLQHADLEHVALRHGSVWTARCPATDRAVGAIAVLRPDVTVPSAAWAAVQDAEAALLGDRRSAADAADDLLAPLRPQEPALVVATMGVAADHRRRGLARRLLRKATDLADELGAPSYLETSTTANVALYASEGFTVLGHAVIPGGPEVWAMRRDPR